MHVLKSSLLIVIALAPAAGCRESTPAESAPGAKEKTPTSAISVVLSAEAIRSAGVSIMKVSQSDLVVRVELPGTVESPRDGFAIVNTRVAGVVDSLEFDVGDRVKAGGKLATVRSIDLAGAQATYQRAVVANRYAEAALQRSEALRSQGVLSERRVEADRLEANEKKLALDEATDRVRILGGAPGGAGGTISVTTPIAGVIATRSANRGQAVEANSPLYTVVDVSRVVVQLRALAGTPVQPGVKAPFTVEALPGRTFTAVVKSASDLLDPETRRFFILCSVNNPDGALKPGMFVTGQLPRQSLRALIVPEGAVQIMPDGPTVFVAKEGGRFERRTIIPGARADGQVAIEHGLADGEAVVIQGAFWIRSQFQKSEMEEG